MFSKDINSVHILCIYLFIATVIQTHMCADIFGSAKIITSYKENEFKE